jgi:hypothetical protein
MIRICRRDEIVFGTALFVLNAFRTRIPIT